VALQHGAQSRGPAFRWKRQHATNGFLGADRFLRHHGMVRRSAATLRA
jgi:predicted deacylase